MLVRNYMNKIEDIIIHCSDSYWGCAREINQWHIKRGWSGIGYHFVILNGIPTFKKNENIITIPLLDGSIECGRYLDDDEFISNNEIGSHVLGLNDKSIGICLIGINKFTFAQMHSLKFLCLDLIKLYKVQIDNIFGHCETESGKKEGKTCPNFDVAKFRTELKGG